MGQANFQHVSGVRVKPFAGGSAAFAFRFDPPGVFILDSVAWTTFAYCVGRTSEDVKTLFMQAAGDEQSPMEVEALAETTLNGLFECGLIQMECNGSGGIENPEGTSGPGPARRIDADER